MFCVELLRKKYKTLFFTHLRFIHSFIHMAAPPNFSSPNDLLVIGVLQVGPGQNSSVPSGSSGRTSGVEMNIGSIGGRAGAKFTTVDGESYINNVRVPNGTGVRNGRLWNVITGQHVDAQDPAIIKAYPGIDVLAKQLA